LSRGDLTDSEWRILDPIALAQRREVSSPRVGVFELAEIGEELQFVAGVTSSLKTISSPRPRSSSENIR
jgi:hypothetical protein